MKDIKETKFISKRTKKSILLVVNVVLIIALVAISTYAWFFRNLADTVNSDEIQFTAGLSLEVNLEDNEETYAYKQTITGFSSSALSKEITGDGIETHFLYPKLATHAASGLYYPDTTDDSGWSDYSSMNANSDYIYRTLYFRSTIPVDIYLANGSYVKAKSEIEGKPVISSVETDLDANRIVATPDNDGNYYSKDCVVGATRIAFSNVGADKPNLIWIPRPDIFCGLTGDKKTVMYGPNSVYDNSGFKNISPVPVTNPFSAIVPDPGAHWYYSIGDHTITTKQLTSVEKIGEGDPNLPYYFAGTKGLPSTDASSSNYGYVGTTSKPEGSTDKYYRTQINVAIWVDGCDAEARKDFVGGKFSVNMQFIGIGK